MGIDRVGRLLVSALLVVAMVACTGESSDDPSPGRTSQGLASRAAAGPTQPVTVPIDPAIETKASFGGFTVTLPAGSTADEGKLTVQSADTVPDLGMPELALTDGLMVSVSGTQLTGEAAISRAMTLGPSSQEAPIVLWETTQGHGAEMLPVKVDRNGGTATVTTVTTHFSQGWFGTLDVKALADGVFNELKGVLVGRSNVEQPHCTGEDALRDKVDVTSDEGDSMKWCAGIRDGKPFVTVANNRRTFTQVAIPPDWTIRDPKHGFSVDVLIRAVGTGMETFAAAFPKDRSIVLIKAGETMTFDAPGSLPAKVEIRARTSMMGYLLQILSQAIDMYSGMMRKFAPGNFDKASAWTGNWFEELQRSTPAKDGKLVEAWATCFRSFTDNVTDEPWNTPTAEELGKVGLFAADCVESVAKAGIEDAGLGGPAAWVVSTIAGIVGTVWGLVNSLSASLRGIWDEVTSVTKKGGSSYSILLTNKEVPIDSPLSLEPGGKILLAGTDVSALPYQDAVARLTSALGPPDGTTPVGGACETHISPGFAVRWKNFRILIQTEDSPGVLGNDRKGRIAGWELSGWGGEQLHPQPTMIGIRLGSTLAETRAAFPGAEEGYGDGTWVVLIGGGVAYAELGGAMLQFESSAADATVRFMDSGYACGS